MIEMSQDITKLVAALHAAQGELRAVAKDATNPHFKNRYATLENVTDTARPVLQKHGIAWTQAPGELVDGAITLTTMLMHTSGQWMRSHFQMPLSKRDPQGTGSAITYACRYALMAVLGLPPTDDDAESATDRAAHVQPQKNSQPARRQPTPDDDDRVVASLVAAMNLARTPAELKKWNDDNKAVIEALPDEPFARVKAAFNDRKNELNSRLVTA